MEKSNIIRNIDENEKHNWNKNKENAKNDLNFVRILKRDLVYIIGIPEELAFSEKLSKFEYFGQYGKIKKIVVNKDKPFSRKNKQLSFSAYITYESDIEASLAILV